MFFVVAIRFAQHKKRNVSLLSRTKATDQGDLRSAKKTHTESANILKSQSQNISHAKCLTCYLLSISLKTWSVFGKREIIVNA